MGAALDTIAYGYGDSSWKDLLTSYDGKQLSSDEIGNLSGDGKWSYSWRRGRVLWDMSRMVDEDAELFEVVQYRYDSNGRRTGKSYGDSYNFRIVGGQLYYVGDSTGTAYYYAGDDLSQIDITFPDNSSTSLHFTYDELGPMSVTYSGAEYFYLKNAQGDVTGLVNSSGTQVVAYTYDAWGNPLTTTGSMAGTLGKLNPFRYRGYVYDTETGLYYLGSRYYNPQWGRFVNADSESLVTASPDSATWDKNLFSYCDNNPITRIDANGGWWHVVIGAAVGVIAQYATDVTINLRQGKSFVDALSPRSSLVDYGAAAISGALAATGIGMGASISANAAISGIAYLSNGSIYGSEITLSSFVEATVAGAAAGVVGGKGANGAKLRGITKTSRAVLKTAVSQKKVAMYTKKIASVKKDVVTSTGRTVLATLATNFRNLVNAFKVRR